MIISFSYKETLGLSEVTSYYNNGKLS
jgi:hypothetical protein